MKNFIIILFIFYLYSCESNVEPTLNNLTTEYLNGLWLVTNSYPTNGPICIFIEKGDTINFEIIDTLKKTMRMVYKSEGIIYKDLFNYNFNNNKLTANGTYKVKYLNKNGEIIDTTFPQNLFIEFFKDSINCSIEHGIIDNESDILVFGEVSKFGARKIKGE